MYSVHVGLLLACFLAFYTLECGSSTLYIDEIKQRGLKKNDIIEWSGTANRIKLKAYLIIRADKLLPNGKRNVYSLLRLEVKPFYHMIVTINGVFTKEPRRRRNICKLPPEVLSQGRRLRILIRVQPRLFMIYVNNALKFILPIKNHLPPSSEANFIAVYHSLEMRTLRLLKDRDLVEKMQDRNCGRPQLNISVPQECNAQKTNRHQRIVGGIAAQPGAHPWQVAILRQNNQGISVHTCGATLISNCWVVSAAHCVGSSLRSTLDDLTVRIGNYNNNEMGRGWDRWFENSQDFEVEDAFIHEQYASDITPINDIVLIKLRSCVSYGRFVQPACLPIGINQFSSKTECGVSGWGAEYDNQPVSDYPPCLQVAAVHLRSDATCQGLLRRKFDAQTMICASDWYHDTCSGDSGGPLVCENSNGRQTLWGLTSWGIGCGNARKPGVYTRLTKYLRWIFIKIKLSPSDKQFQQDIIDGFTNRNYYQPY